MELPNGANAFEGEVKFSKGDGYQNGDLSSKFIRVPEQPSVEKIMNHIRERWQMNDPQFIIEISGNVKENEIAEACVRNNNLKLKNVMKKCLIDIAVKHNAWIVTDGLDKTGLTKYFGDEIARRRAMGVEVHGFGITRWKTNWISPQKDELNSGCNKFIFIGEMQPTDTSSTEEITKNLKNFLSERSDPTKTTTTQTNAAIIPWIKLCLGEVDKLNDILKANSPAILIEGFGGSTDTFSNDSQDKEIQTNKKNGLVNFIFFWLRNKC